MLTADDRDGAPFVVVINQTMAREYFRGSNPIGQQILIRRAPLQPVPSVPDDVWTIVGVVADEGISPFERTAQAAAYATRILLNPALQREMSASARTHACEQFSLRTAAGKLEKIYRGCLQKKRGGNGSSN